MEYQNYNPEADLKTWPHKVTITATHVSNQT